METNLTNTSMDRIRTHKLEICKTLFESLRHRNPPLQLIGDDIIIIFVFMVEFNFQLLLVLPVRHGEAFEAISGRVWSWKPCLMS
jgi:hypothetical protein